MFPSRLLLVTLIAGTGCARASRIDLVGVPQSIIPADRPFHCDAIPDTLIVSAAKGPFTLCTAGVRNSREVFALIREETGRKVFVSRSWQAVPEPTARAAFDSLARELTITLGPGTSCGQDRLIWSANGLNWKLLVEPVTDMVRSDQPWFITVAGQLEALSCGRAA